LVWERKNDARERKLSGKFQYYNRVFQRDREEEMMPNPDQPTITLGATGNVVKRLQRTLRRTPDLGITVDGIFRTSLETAVKELPDGGPMPTLREGSTGAVVSSLQSLLTNGAEGQWNTTPQGIDGQFGPLTKASVEAFQSWGGVAVDGIVGDQTWSVSLHAASATLESGVGLNFVIG
jgi:peptidoglycan hydrolase-like protein with peptidoglycan-binding domain